eukprot:837821-Amphidinium_carterae.1
MQWVCEIIPGSRRTKQGSAAWRVRAAVPPPHYALPARWQHFQFILRIQPLAARPQGRILQWKPSASRASSMQPSSWTQLSRLPPWTAQKTP